MGDTNAVEFGQAGHLLPTLRHGVILPHELLSHGGRASRGDTRCGVIKDDHGTIQSEEGTITKDGVLAPNQYPPMIVLHKRASTSCTRSTTCTA